jgi:hypothetical protein
LLGGLTTPLTAYYPEDRSFIGVRIKKCERVRREAVDVGRRKDVIVGRGRGFGVLVGVALKKG